jgi:hypothetical protein
MNRFWHWVFVLVIGAEIIGIAVVTAWTIFAAVAGE